MPGLLERLRGLVAHNQSAASAVVKLGPFGSYRAMAWSHSRLAKSVYGNPTGYRCIEIICNQFCRPEFEVRKPGTQEGIPTHKTLDVLNHPEATRSGTSMQRSWAMDLELNGRAFWVFMQGRDGLGDAGPITGMKRLVPQRTTVVANMEDELLGFVYQPRAGGRIALLPEQVLYLRWPHPEREYDGLPPAMVAGLAAELDTGAVRFNADLLANDAGMPGYLVVEGLNRAVFSEWKASWDAGESPGKIRFLGSPGQGGKVTFVKTALSNQELTYHELRGDAQSDMCAAFGVPHVLIDPTDATFSNMDAAMLALWRYTVLPKWTIVADDVTIQMGRAAGVEIGVDLSQIDELQEAEDAKTARAKILLELDAIVINEWREDQGLDPLPWGDYALSFLRQLTAPVIAGTQANLPLELIAGMGGGEVNPAAPEMQKVLAERRRAMRTIAQAMPAAFAALTKAHDPRGQTAGRSIRLKVVPESPEVRTAAAGALRTKAARQGYYQRWHRKVKTHEALVSRKMARYFERQKRAVVAKLRASGSKSLTKTLDDATWWDEQRWDSELADDTSLWLADTVDAFGTMTADDLEAEGFDLEDPDVQAYLDEESGRIAGQINDTTFDAVASLLDGLARGAGIVDMVDAVSSWFDDRADRPDLVAAIEVVPAANAGSRFAADQSGQSLTKMWVTAGDDSVDAECEELDGLEVAVEEDFGVGAEPGDLHFGCRCTAVYLKITPQGDEEETGDTGGGDGGDTGGGDGGGDAGGGGKSFPAARPRGRAKYSEDQERADDGKWSGGGGAGDAKPLLTATATSVATFATRGQLRSARAIAVQTANAAPVPTAADRQSHAERVARSGRAGGDDRGNNKDRAARAEFLVKKFGDGEKAPCVHCGRNVTKDTVSADRIYPGSEGGRYTRGNVVPACVSCNSSRQDASFFDIAATWGGRGGRVAA